MGRFSPSVVREATPGFAENLANALSLGVGSYEHFKAARETREDKRRALMDREDELVLHGIMPEGWTPPPNQGSFAEEQPSSAEPPAPAPQDPRKNIAGGHPMFEELPGALEKQGHDGQEVTPPETAQAAVPQSASGHPGGWDPRTRQFSKVTPRFPEPITLPSGRVYDRAGQMQNSIAQHLAERQGEVDIKRDEHNTDVGNRRHALEGLRGQPGYEKLTDALIAAGAEDPQVYQEIVKNEPKAWHPHSMAEALQLHGAEVSQSAAAARGRQDPRKVLMTHLQDVVAGAIALEKRDGVANPTDQNAAARTLNIIGADKTLRPMFDRGEITRDMVWEAVQRYHDSVTRKGAPDEGDDDAFMAMVNGQDPAATHARNMPSQRSAPAGVAPSSSRGDIVLKAPAAPDSLLNQLDEEYGGDLKKIRTELKRRGFDPDA